MFLLTLRPLLENCKHRTMLGLLAYSRCKNLSNLVRVATIQRTRDIRKEWKEIINRNQTKHRGFLHLGKLEIF